MIGLILFGHPVSLRRPKRILRLFCVLSLLPLGSFPAHAECAGDSPERMAKFFFERHRDFHFADPARLKSVTSPRLFSALEREHECAQGDICAIEADPWIDAQDGEIGKPILFETTRSSDIDAAVKMSYTFVLSKQQRSPQSVVLRLQRQSVHDCWRVADLISPKGKSLVQHIEEWHRKYGQKP